MIFLGTQKLRAGLGFLFFFKVSFEKHPNGRESKQHKIALKPHKRARKAMEVLASHLKKEVSSLRFLVEKENGRWRSLVGEEKARELDGLTSNWGWIGTGLAWIDSGLTLDWDGLGLD